MPYKKFIKDIGILGLTQLVSALGGIIILPIITKLLGAENYGTWTQLMVTVGLISSVVLLGLPYTMVRFLAGEKDKKEIQDGIWSVFSIILGISIIISLILIFFSGSISHFFNCPKTFVQILAFIIIFDFSNVIFSNVFRAFQQNIKFCLFTIFQELGEMGLVILTIYSGYGLLGVLFSYLIIRIIIFLIMGSYIVKEIGFKMPKFLKIKEYLSFGLPTIPDNLSGWVIQSSDRYLIGFFLGTLFVGYYNPAYVIGVFVINFLAAPFSFLLPAILSKFYDENKTDEIKIYLRYSLKYFLMIAIPAILGLSVLSKQILTIITTPEIANASYLIMPIVALGMLPNGMTAIIGQTFTIAKKMKIGAMLAIISAALNFGLNLIFIPLFGILGAAITTLIAFIFVFLAQWIYSSKHIIKLEIDWRFVLKSILASLLMASLVFWLNPVGSLKTMLAVILGVLVYGLSIFLLKSFTQQEIQLFKKVIKRA